MLRSVRGIVGVGTLFVAPWVVGATFDCSAFSGYVERTTCEKPELSAGKRTYEATLEQLQRQNPQQRMQILQINRQKLAELNASCSTPECIAQWYQAQTQSLHDGTWATLQRPSPSTATLPSRPDTRTSPSPNDPALAESNAFAQVREPQPELPETSASSTEDLAESARQPAAARDPQNGASPEVSDREPEQASASSVESEHAAPVRRTEALKPSAPPSFLSRIGNAFQLALYIIVGVIMLVPAWLITGILTKYGLSKRDMYNTSPIERLYWRIVVTGMIALFLAGGALSLVGLL